MPFLYIIYSAITWCLYPLVVLWIWYRAAKGKADIKRWREYIGYPSLATCIGSKKLLWVHAASLGEIKAVSPVINRLNTEFPDITILITTTTRSGEEAARTLCSDQVIHQYVCVDCPQAIGRFLIFWQPDYVIFVESEFWPCTLYHIAKLKKKGVKVMLLNARMSPSSHKKWQYFESLLVGMLRVFDIIIAASKRDAKNFAGFSSIQKIKCFGNIKYAINNPEMQNKNNQDRLMLNCNSRSVWLCASIHPGEGKVVLESHNRLRNKIPNLLTIIVPRHMTYCKTLSQEMDHLNIKHVLRSDTDKIIDNTEIYLVDTF